MSVASAKKQKSAAKAAGNNAAAEKRLTLDQAMNKLWDIPHKLREPVNAIDQEIRELETKLAERKKMLAFEKEKAAWVCQAMLGADLSSAMAMQPYDEGLKKLLDKVGGWQTFRDNGASDGQIKEKLGKAWSDWSHGYPGDTKGKGGSDPCVWIDAVDHKPTLQGTKLISEVRRVLSIPQSAKAAPAAKAAAKPKSKRKPAAGPSLAKANADWKEIKKAAQPTTHGRGYSRWLDGVRKAVKRAGHPFDSTDPRLQAWHDAGKSSADAAKLLLSDQPSSLENVREIGTHRPEEQRRAELIAEPLAMLEALAGHEKIDWRGDQAEFEIEGGKTYTPAELGVIPLQLEDAMDGLRIFPAAPDFSEEGCGRIGTPIKIDGERYAVVHATHGNLGTTYDLHPLMPLDEADGTAVSWRKPWEKRGKRAPEELPRLGVKVLDPDGTEWVMGDDQDVFSVDVAKAAETDAEMRGRGDTEKADEIPGVLKVGDKVQIGRGGGIFSVVGIKGHENDGEYEIAWEHPGFGDSPAQLNRDIVRVAGKGQLEQVRLGFEILVNPADPSAPKPSKKSKRKEAYANAT